MDKRYKNKKYETFRLKKRFFDRLVEKFKKKTVVIGKYKNIKNMKYGKKIPPFNTSSIIVEETTLISMNLMNLTQLNCAISITQLRYYAIF
jgi:hypothetical protein